MSATPATPFDIEQDVNGGDPTELGEVQRIEAVPSLEPKPEKKIAIVGFTGSKDKAPWGDPDWEIWICNNLWKHCPDGWDRLYDLHDQATIEGDAEHNGFLSGHDGRTVKGETVNLKGRPVVVWNPQPAWETAVAYPKDAIVDLFGNYFTNSISWMIANAIVENVTELHIYGVDMATSGEYSAQRPSCEYMLGWAAGCGVKIYLPPESDLLKVAFMYGAEDDGPLYAKLSDRERELRARLNQMQEAKFNATIQEAQIRGALENTAYFRSVWTSPRAARDGSAKDSANGKPAEVPTVGAKQ